MTYKLNYENATEKRQAQKEEGRNNIPKEDGQIKHSVTPNEMATQDRFSISFNVFARGMFGDSNSLSRLKI